MTPKVFLCFQEPRNKFDPLVQKKVNDLTVLYGNVVVMCPKSEKLTTSLYTNFLNSVVLPYVEGNEFLLIDDSWGGQTNGQIYDEVIINDRGESTCTLKVIPSKCTPLVQRCDDYFYRQVKQFIKRLQNCIYFFQNQREISSREDGIKIHSLLHHQISAPIFQPMLKYRLKYAW